MCKAVNVAVTNINENAEQSAHFSSSNQGEFRAGVDINDVYQARDLHVWLCV